MDVLEVLQTLAEISIAYVGFSAVFGVLSSRVEAWPVEKPGNGSGSIRMPATRPVQGT